MIFDSLKNSALYYSLNPRLEKAFGFIASTDWEKMEPGIHELDGKDIYVNVMDTELKKPADAKLEAYTDEDSGEITVVEADIQQDITDVPPGILAVLAQSGVCLAELDELIMLDSIIYGN